MYQTSTEELKEQKKSEKPSFKLGKVTALFDDGCPKIQFYGETTTSSKKYKIIEGTTYEIGDLVILASIEDSYVILGTINYETGRNGEEQNYLTQSVADALYSGLSHNHDSTYAKKSHTHDYSSTYAAKNHDHAKLKYASNKYVEVNGNILCPSGSGSMDIGSLSNKFGTIYATTGTIKTSDRNQKHDIEDIDERYKKFFSLLHPVRYKLNDGTSDRYHIGFIAQDVEQIMSECGIDSKEFGGFIKENVEGVDMYALRYEEFTPINTMMLQSLIQTIGKLSQEIDELKGEKGGKEI